MFVHIVIGLFVVGFIIIRYYVTNLDWMVKHHPDYKGEDLFNEDLNSREITPKMIWDDKKKERIARFIKAHKAIDVAADKYAESTFKWPKNKLGENQTIPAGQSVPNGYRKHIKLTKKPFMDGALSETAKNYWYESFRNEKEQN